MTALSRRWKNQAVTAVMGGLLVLCIVPLVSVLYTLVANGWPVINFHFLFGRWKPVGESGGIAHAILGSVALLAVASLFAVPIGLG